MNITSVSMLVSPRPSSALSLSHFDGDYEGGRYVGEWQGGKPHGKGRWKCSDELIMEGTFVEGVFKEGKLFFPDGTIYEGVHDDLNCSFGRGHIYYPDGSVFEGSWEWGRPMFTAGCSNLSRLANGDVYKNLVFDPQENAWTGKVEYARGLSYEGALKPSSYFGFVPIRWEPSGRGSAHDENGFRFFEGEVKSVFQEGTEGVMDWHVCGTLFLRGGVLGDCTFEGEWKDSVGPIGEGTLTMPDGTAYKGSFENYTDFHKEHFGGRFVEDKGRVVHTDGSEYVGPITPRDLSLMSLPGHKTSVGGEETGKEAHLTRSRVYWEGRMMTYYDFVGEVVQGTPRYGRKWMRQVELNSLCSHMVEEGSFSGWDLSDGRFMRTCSDGTVIQGSRWTGQIAGPERFCYSDGRTTVLWFNSEGRWYVPKDEPVPPRDVVQIFLENVPGGAALFLVDDVPEFEGVIQASHMGLALERRWQVFYETMAGGEALNVATVASHWQHLSQKVQVLFLLGHGYPDCVRFGNRGMHAEDFLPLKPLLAQDAVVVLASCSTGKEGAGQPCIAQKLADLFGEKRRVVAPQDIAYAPTSGLGGLYCRPADNNRGVDLFVHMARAGLASFLPGGTLPRVFEARGTEGSRA